MPHPKSILCTTACLNLPRFKQMIRLFYFVVLGLTFWPVVTPSSAQSEKQAVPACGAVEVQIEKPIYLLSNEEMIAVELPDGWLLDGKYKNPYYFLLEGDSYESEHTLIYIIVEALKVSFEQSIEADIALYKKNCKELNIQYLQSESLLEQGCENRTQIFTCNEQQNSYVDLVTNINFNGLLLHVVLSADTSDEITRYRNDYDFLLKHLTVIKLKN